MNEQKKYVYGWKP